MSEALQRRVHETRIAAEKNSPRVIKDQTFPRDTYRLLSPTVPFTLVEGAGNLANAERGLDFLGPDTFDPDADDLLFSSLKK
jgi:hypothetical protein